MYHRFLDLTLFFVLPNVPYCTLKNMVSGTFFSKKEYGPKCPRVSVLSTTISIFAFTHLYRHIYAYQYTYTYVLTHTYIDASASTYTHIHTYIL